MFVFPVSSFYCQEQGSQRAAEGMSIVFEEPLPRGELVRSCGTPPSRGSRGAISVFCIFLVSILQEMHGANVTGVEDEGQQVDLAKLSPEALTRRACTICHMYTEPSMLTKKNWREQILPRMGVELGIFPPDYSKSPEGELLRSKHIYPDAPRIPKELWPRSFKQASRSPEHLSPLIHSLRRKYSGSS